MTRYWTGKYSGRSFAQQRGSGVTIGKWFEKFEEPRLQLRSSAACLKNLEVNRQVLLGVFANRFHQMTAFHQHLIGIVVQPGIFEQQANTAFPCFEPG